MQITVFPFEAIVHDDASTDGSAAIVLEYAEKYPDVIKAIIEKENQYSKKDGSLNRIMMENTRGQYVAYCEGDDYWTDPYKLQKQVNALTANPKATLCYTGFTTVNDKGEQIFRSNFEWYRRVSHSGSNLSLLFRFNYIMTLTVCVRREVLESKLFQSCPHGYDYAFFLAAAFMGDFEYIDDVTGCYRKNPTSLTQTVPITSLSRALDEVAAYFAEQYILGYKMPLCWKDKLLVKTRVLAKLLKEKRYIYVRRLFLENILISPVILIMMGCELVANRIRMKKLRAMTPNNMTR